MRALQALGGPVRPALGGPPQCRDLGGSQAPLPVPTGRRGSSGPAGGRIPMHSHRRVVHEGVYGSTSSRFERSAQNFFTGFTSPRARSSHAPDACARESREAESTSVESGVEIQDSISKDSERNGAERSEGNVTIANNLESVSCPIDTYEADDRDESGSLAETSGRALETEGIPVFVMLPLDTVTSDGCLNQKHLKALDVGLRALKAARVDGVMVDVWWGVVEREGPGQYEWAAYKRLLQMVRKAGLHMSAVMSFHACGGNVGDSVYIPLPAWAEDAMKEDPDLMYTDRHGSRNPECISLFADNANTLRGRTPMQCYVDFMESFRDAMGEEIGRTVTDISVGCGPCGELRYPAYPESAGRWHFPGLGEFQCYDKRALGSLAAAASEAGRIEWGGSGPHDSGTYNDRPHQTGFFNGVSGSWRSDYGDFFLTWYSGELLRHGDRMLGAAAGVFGGKATINLKCAGVHWWFNSRSHAAELTAGYYNTRHRDGYDAIAELCDKHGAHLNFTCVEMRDYEHPQEACCGPEGLLRQVRTAAARWGVPVAGENALTRFDGFAYDRVVENAVGVTVDDDPSLERLQLEGDNLPPMAAFTFLRLTPMLFEEHNMREFVNFVSRVKSCTAESAVQLMELGSDLRFNGGYAELDGLRKARRGGAALAGEDEEPPGGDASGEDGGGGGGAAEGSGDEGGGAGGGGGSNGRDGAVNGVELGAPPEAPTTTGATPP